MNCPPPLSADALPLLLLAAEYSLRDVANDLQRNLLPGQPQSLQSMPTPYHAEKGDMVGDMVSMEDVNNE